jgi:hypothetical protein
MKKVSIARLELIAAALAIGFMIIPLVPYALAQ